MIALRFTCQLGSSAPRPKHAKCQIVENTSIVCGRHSGGTEAVHETHLGVRPELVARPPRPWLVTFSGVTQPRAVEEAKALSWNGQSVPRAQTAYCGHTIRAPLSFSTARKSWPHLQTICRRMPATGTICLNFSSGVLFEIDPEPARGVAADSANVSHFCRRSAGCQTGNPVQR